MRILFLPKYGRMAASSRYRFFQYFPLLQSLGYECVVAPLLEDDYLSDRFRTGRKGVGSVLRGFLNRWKILRRAREFDLAVVNYELFPYLPSFCERSLTARKIPYVYDFDDAVFHTYDEHPNRLARRLLAGKIRTVIGGAQCVIAGNEYLADYARLVNRNVHVLPTAIDLDRYPAAAERDPSRTFTVGWIGSPSTAEYVRDIEPALASFCERRGARLVLVGFGTLCKLATRAAEVRPWSEETEVAEISRFDVGIMPVPDTLWGKGKCGFKLIQYMACGVPVIASPVGVNTQIVEHGVNGYLTTGSDDWTAALESLYANATLRRTMGAAGRQKVAAEYSLQVTGPRFAALLQQAFRSGRSGCRFARAADAAGAVNHDVLW